MFSTKQICLDLMERSLAAYSDADVRAIYDKNREGGIKEHGFPRLVANLGVLIANGRALRYRDLFADMMDFCTEKLPTSYGAGNDFSVRELCTAILAIEENAIYPPTRVGKWRENLAKFDPYKAYDKVAPAPDVRVGNWTAFNAVSEYMRGKLELSDPEEFLNLEIPTQLLSFDENGMYRDPHEPMVYDLVTRGLFAALLSLGYDGKYRAAIEEQLDKSARPTLLMQSPLGEIPFGGRSNQMIYNEALIAIFFEYHAARAKEKGDLAAAGEYKRASHLALSAVAAWLDRTGNVTHVKNRFPRDLGFGCEDYAYFDKYMITLASFAYLVCLCADDDVAEAESCPALRGGYTFATSPYFHKTFLSEKGYFLEFETKPDRHYDAFGLGRIHKAGVPAPLCLSLPGTATPKYRTGDITPAHALSLSGGFFRDGEEFPAADLAEEGTLTAASPAAATLVYPLGGSTLTERYEIDDTGVRVELSGENDLFYTLPAFASDGREETAITHEKQKLTVRSDGHSCTCETNGEIIDKGEISVTRNGLYHRFLAIGKAPLSVKITLA